MVSLIAYCGLECGTCPIYLATRQPDPKERTRMRWEIIRQCREHYGIEYTLEDITDCDGCSSQTGRLFRSSSTCSLRKCARDREIKSCASCSDYPCQRLAAFLSREPAAKKRLEQMRSSTEADRQT